MPPEKKPAGKPPGYDDALFAVFRPVELGKTFGACSVLKNPGDVHKVFINNYTGDVHDYRPMHHWRIYELLGKSAIDFINSEYAPLELIERMKHHVKDYEGLKKAALELQKIDHGDVFSHLGRGEYVNHYTGDTVNMWLKCGADHELRIMARNFIKSPGAPRELKLKYGITEGGEGTDAKPTVDVGELMIKRRYFDKIGD